MTEEELIEMANRSSIRFARNLAETHVRRFVAETDRNSDGKLSENGMIILFTFKKF